MTRTQRRRAQRREAEARMVAAPPAPAPAPVATPSPRASYHAAGASRKRAIPQTTTRREDDELSASDRRRLRNAILDQGRNFSLISWAVNKVVNFNTRFTFQARTRDDQLNQTIEDYLARRALAPVFDASARMDLGHFLRVLYACQLADGDAFGLRLSGGAVQGVEGDRVSAPTTGDKPAEIADYVHGVKYGPAGRPETYCLCKRESYGRLLFERLVQADRMIPLVMLRRFDQGRGISPLASAVNAAQDLYETAEAYALKSKMIAWAGMVIKRSIKDSSPFAPFQETVAASDEDGNDRTEYEISANGRPFTLDMDPGDSLEVVESGTPPSEYIEHAQLLIRMVLLALDIPFTFYDQTRGSYTIQKDAWTQWEIDSQPKRDMVVRWLDAWTDWQLRVGLARGEISMPRGMTVAAFPWEWQHEGRPWMDSKEVAIDVESVRMGLEAATDVIRRHGKEPAEVLRKNAEYYAAMRAAGLPTSAWDDQRRDPQADTEEEDRHASVA